MTATAGTPARTGTTERWLLLVSLCAMQFALMAGDTSVNIALPSIRAEFGLLPTELVWVVNGYTLAFGGLLVVAGRAGDKFGLVRVFTIGTVVFGVCSVACALAPTAGWLVAARFAQGVGAAMIAPAVLGLITVVFTDDGGRARAFAVWSGTMVVGGTVGMLASGVITEAVSWRAAFLVTVPFAVLGAVAAPRFARLAGGARQPVRIGVPAALLLTASITGVLYGLLSVSGYGVLSAPVLLGIAGGALCFAGFRWLSARSATPVIPRLLLRDRGRVAALFAGMLGAGGMFSVFFVLTLFLRTRLGYDALGVSWAYLPTGAACLVGTWLAGRYLPRLGVRRLVTASLAVSALGVLSLALLVGAGTYAVLVPGLVLFSGGLSAAMPGVAQAGVARIPPGDAGVCSAAVNSTQQIGGTVALALAAVLLQSSDGYWSGLLAAAVFVGLAGALGLSLRLGTVDDEARAG